MTSTLIVRRVIDPKGKGYIEAKLNGKKISWGAKLSKKLIKTKLVGLNEGICTLTFSNINGKIQRGEIVKEFTLPPLNFMQSDEDFSKAFQTRVEIVKEMEKFVSTYKVDSSFQISLETEN